MSGIKAKVRAVIRQEVKEGLKEAKLRNTVENTASNLSSKIEKVLSDDLLVINELSEISLQQQSLISAASSNTESLKQLEQKIITQNNKIDQILKGREIAAPKADTIDVLTKEFQTALKRDDEAQLLSISKKIAAEKKKNSRRYTTALNSMRDSITERGDPQKYREITKVLFDAHTVDEFRREDYLDASKLRIPVMQAASLRQQFVRRRRMKQIGDVPDRWLVYNKKVGEEFAASLGVKCPASEHGYTLDTIPRKDNIVIKPLFGASSKGVYIVYNTHNIWSVENKITFSSWEDMLTCIRQQLDAGEIQKDLFEIQEAIYSDNTTKSATHDLKFYTFYGEIPAVLEIVRTPEKAYWWWNERGELIDIGQTMPESIQPMGFTAEMLETARQLSLKIPAPYMRLDFLRSADDIYFDEFCTMSGGEFAIILEQHFPKWDRLFGNCYLKAEMRIMNDLLEGKRFDEINEFNRHCEERYKNKSL